MTSFSQSPLDPQIRGSAVSDRPDTILGHRVYNKLGHKVGFFQELVFPTLKSTNAVLYNHSRKQSHFVIDYGKYLICF